MSRLRIVQGGIENGDKTFIEECAANGGRAEVWTVPKDSTPGDDVVIYIGGYGLYATAKIDTQTKPRKHRPNRYGAGITGIRLIEPAISLVAIRRHIPNLSWANYPRSINTPDDKVAKQIRELIRCRRITRQPDIDEHSLNEANIDELRIVAMMRAKASASKSYKQTIYRARSLAIKLYVLRRADGYCEYCQYEAPFQNSSGELYLEPHHIMKLADDGPDDPVNVIALCPNCHRRAHYADDATKFNSELKKIALDLESKQ